VIDLHGLCNLPVRLVGRQYQEFGDQLLFLLRGEMSSPNVLRHHEADRVPASDVAVRNVLPIRISIAGDQRCTNHFHRVEPIAAIQQLAFEQCDALMQAVLLNVVAELS